MPDQASSAVIPSEPVSVVPIGATLGEGPIWVARDAALWFVDIKAPAIHRFEPGTDALRSWPAPEPVGWVQPWARGGFLAGLKSGIHHFDPVTGKFERLFNPESSLPGNRLNDAAVDPEGRLWFGSMDDGEAAPTGLVYRLGTSGCQATRLPAQIITNGPAVGPDGQTLYPVDTVNRRIWRVHVLGNGRLGAPHLLATIEEGAGYPDGAVCDAEGCIWVGLFAGWSARRYSPSGELLQSVRFPVANVTKIAFGGDGLGTAYATTARKGLDAAALLEQPEAGNVFAFDAGVAGIAPTEAHAEISFFWDLP